MILNTPSFNFGPVSLEYVSEYKYFIFSGWSYDSSGWIGSLVNSAGTALGSVINKLILIILHITNFMMHVFMGTWLCFKMEDQTWKDT